MESKHHFEFRFVSQLFDQELCIVMRRLRPRAALANLHTFAPLAGPMLDVFGKLSPDQAAKLKGGDLGKVDLGALGAGLSAALQAMTPAFVDNAVTILFAEATAEEPRENGTVPVKVTAKWLDEHMSGVDLAKAIGTAYVETYKGFLSGLVTGASTSPR
jgi:hypothetical protein